MLRDILGVLLVLCRCAARTQRLELTLGFKTAAINRAGERSSVHGFDRKESARDIKNVVSERFKYVKEDDKLHFRGRVDCNSLCRFLQMSILGRIFSGRMEC